MKGNDIILFFIFIVLGIACAVPRVSINSRSQARRLNRKGGRIVFKGNTADDEGGKSGKVQKLDSDYSEGEGQVEKIGDNDYDDPENVSRPLTIGDTFTARELLPVAEKLFEKIDHPGEGKGIVSSSTQPQELSDKLFKAIFITSDRIVTLTEDDIIALDTLQRLALVGEPALRSYIVDQTDKKAKKKVIDLNGQIVEIDDQPRTTSELKVLTKQTLVRLPKVNKTKEIRAKRRENKLIKRLHKNRHLVVVQRKNLENNKGSQESAACRWSYECKNPVNLDTCRLKENCTLHKPKEKVDHSAYIISNADIDPKIIKSFRKSLSLNALDEEVEKIIESRVLKYKPKNMGSAENIESLSEYFRKIMLSSDKAVTTAIGDDEYKDTTESNTKGKKKLKADDGKVKRLSIEDDDERRVKRNGR